jgi:glutamate-1-semialdehyde 2,1-aminomutase
MGTGQKLYTRAKNIIPGGNMLLSKRSEMFLPDQWPAYFSKAKGCKVV